MSKSQRQHGGAVAGARRVRGGRVPLVLLHRQAAVGRLPLLDGGDRRGGAAVPAASCGARTSSTCSTRTRTRGRCRKRPPIRARRPRRTTSTAGRCRAPRRPPSWWRERLDDYDATAAGRAIAELVDELSNWYVRRSRRRFWDGDPEAFRTLRACLLTVAKLLAPFCPFVADEIYDNLDGDAGERAPVRLPRRRCAAGPRRRAGGGDGDRARDRAPRPGGAGAGEDQGAPAARGGRRGGGGARARRDRAPRRRGARRAQRQARALRGRRRGAGALRGQGQLPPPRPAVRPRDAAGRRGDHGAGPRARGGGGVVWWQRRDGCRWRDGRRCGEGRR